MSRIVKIKPKPGQESVWDYPRPPLLEPFKGSIKVNLGGQWIVETTRGYRLLETSHPPNYYLPMADFIPGVLVKSAHTSFCEFKGMAQYYHFQVSEQIVQNCAWTYPKATGPYKPLQDCLALYAHPMDACYVGDERVVAQEGDFYGGWITSNIVGPFKGAPGTWGW